MGQLIYLYFEPTIVPFQMHVKVAVAWLKYTFMLQWCNT